MFSALARAFAQLPEPPLLRAVALSVVGAVLAILAAAVLAWMLIFELSILGDGFLGGALAWTGAAAAAALAFLFYPSTAMLIAGFFFDSVADAVEARHYPGLPPARRRGIGETLASALPLLGVTLAINIVLLPVYLLALVVPGLSAVLFYLANGYVFGREFFEAAAGRRLDRQAVRDLRKSRRGTVFLAGVAITVLTTVPILNLAAPVIASAFIVHVFQRLRAEAGP